MGSSEQENCVLNQRTNRRVSLLIFLATLCLFGATLTAEQKVHDIDFKATESEPNIVKRTTVLSDDEDIYLGDPTSTPVLTEDEIGGTSETPAVSHEQWTPTATSTDYPAESYCPPHVGRYPDKLPRGGNNWTNLLINNVFPCDGNIVGWEYYRLIPEGTAYVGVWRQHVVDSNFSLIAKTELLSAPVGIREVKVSPIPVKMGDFIGIFYPRSTPENVIAQAQLADDTVSSNELYQNFQLEIYDEDIQTHNPINLEDHDYKTINATFSLRAVMDNEVGPNVAVITSPEPCLEGRFRCNDGTCIPRSQFCNGESNCPDGSDEFCGSCREDQFQCKNGQCISRDDVCNANPDCDDYSDELPALCISTFPTVPPACPAGYTHCAGGNCLENCEGPMTCSSDQFRCNEGLDCYPNTMKCDGMPDCPDGADEIGCDLETSCDHSAFTCGNGRCLDFFNVCDGNNDCGDNSDEVYCLDCPAEKFKCANSECIDSFLKCDGSDDCGDNSDEEECPIRTSLDPDELTIGTTNDLHFMCVVPRQNSPDFFRWISIAISHSQRTDNPQFEDLLIIKRFEGETQKISFQQFRSDVKIESDGVAHVRISWREPTLNRGGLYRCDVHGIDTWGRPLTVSSTPLLSASGHDVDSINQSIANLRSIFGETIKKIKSEISDLKTSIKQNDCKSNCSEVSTFEISNLKEELRQNIELVKQQEDLRIKLENDVNNTNRLISSELNNLREITENLTAELNNKSRSEMEMKCQEKVTNLTVGNEQALLRINAVNNDLTNEIIELKINQSNQYIDLRNSIQVCKADLSNARERFRTMITEIKIKQLAQKLVQRNLLLNFTNVRNLLNTLKTNVCENTQNLSSLKLTIDRHQSNHTQLNVNNWETLQKSLKDKLELNIKNATSSLTKLVKDFKDFNRRAVSPRLLFKDELKKLFFGSSCLRYWLTKNTYTQFSVADAQSMCVRFGGYLAEIDSDVEYEIIRNFVVIHKSRGTVLVGGTDGLSEGTWINRYRLTPIVPHWSSRPKRPTYIKEDCQCLIHRVFTWEPRDCSCYFHQLSNAGFLCEIPQ